MNTRLSLLKNCLWSVTASILLMGCGVPVTDYEALQKENQELQKSIDQGNAQMRQLQGQLQAAQQGLQAAAGLQARLRDLEEQLAEKDAEIQALHARFEKFKADRRGAMIGKEFPMLRLDEGKVLQKAQITAINGNELSIRHESGFLKVALAKSSDELRWQACFDADDEAVDARQRMLAGARQLSDELDRARKLDSDTGGISAAASKQSEIQEVRTLIAQQRAALNRAHSALAARYPAALRGAHWDSAYPENSGLINVFSERRAVIGINELDSLAAAIKANLLKLRNLEPGNSR